MWRRLLRVLVRGGFLLGLVVAVRRTVSLRGEVERPAPSPDPWTPISVPEAPVTTWVAAGDDGSCPATHPIKAKSASGIYHLPGMFAYDRTKPDRCYRHEVAAVADGFIKAKR